MSIQVRPLLAPYALAAGETILARIKGFGELPSLLQDPYTNWLTRHQALTLLPNNPVVRTLDPFLDRVVLLPAYICQEILRAYQEVPVPLSEGQRQRLSDARTLLAVFGNDLRQLVNIPFVEEWATIRDLLRLLREDPVLCGVVQRLGLTEDIALCTGLHEAYGKALGIGTDLDKNAPERKVADWNESFRELLIGASFLSRSTPGLVNHRRPEGRRFWLRTSVASETSRSSVSASQAG